MPLHVWRLISTCVYLVPHQPLTWTLQAALSGSESLEVEVYDYEKLRSNRCGITHRDMHSTFAPILQAPYLMHVMYM